MTRLTGKARKHLRGLAHHYRAAVLVGKEVLTEGVLKTIDEALLGSELIKVQIAADRDERRRMASLIEDATGAECVGQIGRIAILYRRHPDPEKRRIVPPS